MQSFFNFDFNGFDTEAPASSEDSDPPEFYEEVYKGGKKYHNCTFPGCKKTFRFKSEFLRHNVIHIVKRPFVCPHAGCNKNFKREDALKNHVRLHTGETPFTCEVPDCNMSFSTKAGLRYHMFKHNEGKYYACSIPGCGKTFLTTAQVKQHENCSNYHKKLVPQKIEDPAPIAVTISEKKPEKEENVFLEGLVLPELDCNIQWEMKEDINSQVIEAPIPISVTTPEKEMKENIGSQVIEAPIPISFTTLEKNPEKEEKVFFDAFFVPDLNSSSGIQWEMKDQFEDQNDTENPDDIQEEFEKMVKVILTENDSMKQKVIICDTLMKLLQENRDLKHKLSKVSGYNEPPAPSSMNDDIFSFMNV